MCDIMIRVLPDRVLFAKNSDRDANEAQLLDWRPRREYPAGTRLRCTWITIPQARATHAVLLSRPFWIWGAETGANEHGVVIGNTAVFTRQPLQRSGLTGMDLLRLALERGATAERAVAVIVEFLESIGQGGGCGHEHRTFAYHNSFLVADPGGAFLLESAGRKWQVERIAQSRSISNGLTLPGMVGESDRLKTRVSMCGARRECTSAAVDGAGDLSDFARALRDHGSSGTPRYHWINGAMAAPCMHAGGLLAASQTTASWISKLTPNAVQHWVTATAAPCTGLFKPVRVDEPLDLGPAPSDRADPHSLWWRHERLHRHVMRDPARLLPLFSGTRDSIESQWWSAPPEPAAAFAQGDRLLAAWTQRVLQAGGVDVRPAYVRRYWRKRDRMSVRADTQAG